MTATTQATDPRVEVRSLEKTDLDAVVALDGRNVGRSRRGYFERRLASALRDPKSHLQLAAVGLSGLEGFALARITSGEYGRPEPAVLLEAIGVEPSRQHAGIGRRMLGALRAKAVARGIGTVVTEVDWRNHAMLQYLAGAGFTLAPRLLLDRVVTRMPLPETDEAIELAPPPYRGFAPKLTFGGSLFVSSGSRPSRYYQPMAMFSAPLVKHLSWNAEWLWYGFGETFYMYEGFRDHMMLISLKLSR